MAGLTTHFMKNMRTLGLLLLLLGCTGCDGWLFESSKHDNWPLHLVSENELGIRPTRPSTAAAAAVVTVDMWDMAVQEGARVVQDKLNVFSIPSFNVAKGGLLLQTKDTICRDLAVGEARGYLLTSGGLGIHWKELTTNCDSLWHFEGSIWPHLPRGSGTVKINAISVGECNVGVEIDLTTGRPVTKFKSCDLDLDILLDFHLSKWSVFLNAFRSIIEKTLASHLQQILLDQIEQVIDVDLNDAIANYFKVKQPLPWFDGSALVDFRFREIKFMPSRAIVLCNGHVTDSQSGMIYRHISQVEIVPAQGQMATFSLDGVYLIESLLDIYTVHGYFHWLVTPASLPADWPLKLNTPTFRLLVPGLYAMYPDRDMEIKVLIEQSPTVKTVEGSLVLTSSFVHLVFVVTGQGPPVEAFALSANVSVSGTVQLNREVQQKNTSMGLQFSSISIDLSQEYSNFGIVYVDKLQRVINGLCRHSLLGIFNDRFQRLYQLPWFEGIGLGDFNVTTTLSGWTTVAFDALRSGTAVLI